MHSDVATHSNSKGSRTQHTRNPWPGRAYTGRGDKDSKFWKRSSARWLRFSSSAASVVQQLQPNKTHKHTHTHALTGI